MSPTSDPTYPEGENAVPTTVATTKTNTDNVEMEGGDDLLWDIELLIVVMLLFCCLLAGTFGCILFIKRDSKQKNRILKQIEAAAVPQRLSSDSDGEVIQNHVNIQVVEGG